MKLIVLLLVIVQNLGLIEAIPDCPEGQKFCVSNMACNDCCANNDCETGSECKYVIKLITLFERYQEQFLTLPSSFNECSTIMIDDDNTDPDIAEPCGGLQCIDELHCCNLAVGCQQCCSKHHCKRWEKCL